MEFTPAGADAVVGMAESLPKARQISSAVRQDQVVRRYRLYLDGTANNNAASSILIGASFKAFAITGASDDTATAYLVFNKQTDSGGIESMVAFKGVTHDFGETMNTVYAYWTTAQTGRWIEISLFAKGVYRNNTINLNNSGGSALLDGTAITTSAVKTVTTTAGIIIATDATRKSAWFENQGTAPIYYGDANVTVPGGAFPGLTLLPGARESYNNQADLYAVCASGTVAVATMKGT